mgnify:CR=1 FL=1
MEFALNAENKPVVVEDDVVVSLQYTLTVDSEVVDSSEEDGPISFIQGYGNIIPGLERELYGMRAGQSKHVSVAPADGYGDVDPEAVMEVPTEELPEDIPLEVGVELEILNDDGEELSAIITAVNEAAITLDFNHPLAGKKLEFDVTIVDLRAATPEELEHGHVHNEDDDEEDEQD